MATVIWLLFIFGLATLAFYQLSSNTSLILALLLLTLVSSFAPAWSLVFFWAVWLVCAFGKLMPQWRLRLLTLPVMRGLRRTQPPLSAQEREVIESGSLWWETEIFSGRPNWEKLLGNTHRVLSDAEQVFLDTKVSEFCALLNSWQIRQQNDLPAAAWQFIKQERLWALEIPREYGGLGFSAAAHSAIITKIASQNTDAAITVMVPNSLGPASFILHFGTEQQKQYYLPRLSAGEDIACFALTSAEAGSDAASIIDRGVLCHGEFGGEAVLGIRLNFDKRYITLAPVATLVGLAFQLHDPDHLLGEKENLGISCALVPTHLAGVECGERHKPMNLAFMNGPIRGREVFIPLDYLVGGAESAGRGWMMLMECLAVGRSISLPALATAVNQYSLLVTSGYAKLRAQFKRPIGEFEGVAADLAKITGYSYLAEATRALTATAVDAGCKPSVASAIAKYNLTELARQSVNHAMDIHAGKGVQDGPSNYLTHVYNAVPISITVEGANLLTRNLIIFGQGLMRCHPYLKQEMELLSDQSTVGVKKFDRLLMRHIGFTLSSLIKTVSYGLTAGRLIGACRSGVLKYFLQQLTRISSAFALITDVSLLVIGGKLKAKESLSARFADIVSHFYMASAVIRFYEQQKKPQPDNAVLQWTLSYCLHRIGQSFKQILENFPSRLLGKLLWRVIFPYGNGYQAPKDQLSQQVADKVLNDRAWRCKLTSHCYLGGGQNPVAQLEAAFQQSFSVQALLASLPSKGQQPDPMLLAELEALQQQNLIKTQDYAALKTFLQLRQQVIHVDEFTMKREPHDSNNDSAYSPCD